MESRRSILKKLLFAGATPWFLPEELLRAENQSVFTRKLGFEPGTEMQLASVVDAIVPATKTPGAKDLGVHLYILRMMKDCTGEKDRNAFMSVPNKLDEYSKTSSGKTFASSTLEQRTSFLRELAKSNDASLKSFATTARKMTIDGYTTSEYFMTNVVPYKAIPGSFKGCVKVTQS